MLDEKRYDAEEATAHDWEDWYSPEKVRGTLKTLKMVTLLSNGWWCRWVMQVKQETQTSLLKKKAEHFAGNYQGPLYARHPDLVKKDKEWTNPPRHTLTVCSKVV